MLLGLRLDLLLRRAQLRHELLERVGRAGDMAELAALLGAQLGDLPRALVLHPARRANAVLEGGHVGSGKAGGARERERARGLAEAAERRLWAAHRSSWPSSDSSAKTSCRTWAQIWSSLAEAALIPAGGSAQAARSAG